jgi:hypothetical protein
MNRNGEKLIILSGAKSERPEALPIDQFPLVFFVLAANKSKKAETAAQMSS